MRCDDLDAKVLTKISDDLSSDEFIDRITKVVKETLLPKSGNDDVNTIRRQFNAITEKIDSLTGVLAETKATTALLRKIEKFEEERVNLEIKLEESQHLAAQSKVINARTNNDVKKAIAHNVEALDTLNREDLKEFLRKLVDSVILNPADLTCSLNYRISISRGDKLASPRGFAHILRAAVSPACDTLRIPSTAKQCFALSANEKAAMHIHSGFRLLPGVPKGIRTPVLTVKG